MIEQVGKEVKPNRDTLVTGRAGELVDYASPRTFDLVKKILGHNGPYRMVLTRFGIGDSNNDKDFVRYVDGRVYTDIDIETDVLWKPCSFKLEREGDKVVNNFHFYGPMELFGYIKKSLIEIWHIALVDNTISKADKIYKEFSANVKEVFEEGKLSENHFLKLYEGVVYVSQMYELIFSYNNNKKLQDWPNALREYVRENDYFLSEDRNYVEFVFKLSEIFGLGEKVDLNNYDDTGLKVVPDSIPDFDGVAPKELAAEAKLQCLKNNMRLKTEVLLFFLNLNYQV